MTFDNNHLILAQTAEQSPAPAGDTADGDPVAKPGGSFGLMPFFVLMFVIMYFLMIRPQQKRAKEHKQRIDSLKKGCKVISAGGIHGLVTNISDKTVTVKVSDSTKIKFEKASITQVFGGKDEPTDSSDESDDDSEADDDGGEEEATTDEKS